MWKSGKIEYTMPLYLGDKLIGAGGADVDSEKFRTAEYLTDQEAI